jgi:hypothetical protein
MDHEENIKTTIKKGHKYTILQSDSTSHKFEWKRKWVKKRDRQPFLGDEQQGAYNL